MQDILFNYPGLSIKAASVFDLVIDESSSAAGSGSATVGKIAGVKLGALLVYFSPSSNPIVENPLPPDLGVSLTTYFPLPYRFW